ncbi:MAG: pyridoxal phosphate-dependent aminotransferase [Ruminococcaceae bacterium]|jgi:aspartate aminotransferase|nr:pyridoxal phosphate-dependent aminotransferase [Oscillospiraceae bacterium]
MKFSSKVERCRLSPMRKFHPYAVAAEQRGRRIYHLNIGQPDIATPSACFDAVRRFNRNVLAYAPSPGIPELIEAIRGYYARLGMDFAADDILITTGGSEALAIAFQCILDDGDEVLIPEPFYPNYNTMVATCGAHIHPIPTCPEEGYRYADRARIEAEINEHTRAIVVTNPGNPTGVVLTHDEMRMIADVAKEHDLFLISDEAYREFVYGGEALQSMGEFADAAEHVVLIDTVSKRFSACGARVGCLISRNRELMGHALKYCQSRLSVATLDQVAAAALYGVDPSYFAAVREEYKLRRDTVVAALQRIPGVLCECPPGAFYLMAALPVDDADTFQQWLLEEFEDNGDTVMFAPGEPFYATPGKGRNEIRIAYVLKQADLERAMELLAKGIEAYNNR